MQATTPDTQRDSQLMSLLQSGDITAFDEIARYYGPVVMRFLRLWGCDRPTAEDLSQETLLKVFTKCDLFDPSRRLAPWILRIARNLLRDSTAKEGRNVLCGASRDVTDAFSRLDDAEHSAEIRDDYRSVQAALERLPDAQRECVELQCLHSMTTVQIAEQIGVSPNTVRSRIRLARSHARRVLLPTC